MTEPARILAISDIHGYGLQLDMLLNEAHYRPGVDRLFLLGDYVNKGPDSEGTLARIRKLCDNGAVALCGNNEQKWLQRGDAPYWSPFLRALPLWSSYGGFTFVHAGIRPGISLEQQSVEDLTAIRDPFLSADVQGADTIVFGHTPAWRLGAGSGQIWVGDRKIAIDTGAGHGMALTLVDLTGGIAYCITVVPGAAISRYSFQTTKGGGTYAAWIKGERKI